MVRKIITAFIIGLMLVGATCTQALAETHSVYTEGNMNTTYITYFKDILSGTDLNDNYVAFRSGQYEYTMVVGKLEHNNNTITLTDIGKAKTKNASIKITNFLNIFLPPYWNLPLRQPDILLFTLLINHKVTNKIYNIKLLKEFYNTDVYDINNNRLIGVYLWVKKFMNV